ncbi:MAG TPA: type I-E CRISPR-associated protein Cse1/CasA, partial [Deltaproteobacteria bacterium]|nr:type I-E CRISPR-associated protein Cse1/CasA [Deltaproteobacteria bacterium]
FWQPAHIELIPSDANAPCDVLGGEAMPGYAGFRKEKFNFAVEGLWPHPHGVMTMNLKKDPPRKFAGFTTEAPAWTLMSEFVVPRNLNDPEAKEGSVPAAAVIQAGTREGDLHLLVGGYRTNQASVLERRHEMMSLAQSWRDDKERLPKLVGIAKGAKKALRGKLYFAVQGNKDKNLKGIGANIHETADKLFYARTESLIHATFSNEVTFREWGNARTAFAESLGVICRKIFTDLTDPYARDPDLIPIIAWARRSLEKDLRKLTEES